MVRLVAVNKDNWQECIKLSTSPNDHVAPNVYSIAEAQFYPEVKACCIYEDDKMVGFTMYGPHNEDNTLFWIDRMMIAKDHRGKGYGRTALLAVLDDAKRQGFSRIGLSTIPENVIAIQLYESVGFNPTGEMDDREAVYLRVENEK